MLSGSGQDIRRFTVQIINQKNNAVVGTGFVVSPDGHIVTCAHVLDFAGVDPATGNQISSNLHTIISGHSLKGSVGVRWTIKNIRNGRASLVAHLPGDYQDDIVLLQLTDPHIPIEDGDFAILGTFIPFTPFRSYGYIEFEPFSACWATGDILNRVEQKDYLKLMNEYIQLKSEEIENGMSGAGVLDTERNLVVGMISKYLPFDAKRKNWKTAWAVDIEKLNTRNLLISLLEFLQKNLLTNRPHFTGNSQRCLPNYILSTK